MAAGDEYLAWKIAAVNAQPVKLTYCPKCGMALVDGPRGLHCPMGDWVAEPTNNPVGE